MPKKGDRICPISKTKANPTFVWIVGGKSYTFCCPPCIDEFVKTAKEKPDRIKDPGPLLPCCALHAVILARPRLRGAL